MELKRFITQSLVEIMTGLEDAQSQLKKSIAPEGAQLRGRICPSLTRILDKPPSNILGISSGSAISTIDYDIAVEVSSEQAGAGQIKVAAVFISASGGGEKTTANKDAARIKFSVPVVYPEG